MFTRAKTIDRVKVGEIFVKKHNYSLWVGQRTARGYKLLFSVFYYRGFGGYYSVDLPCVYFLRKDNTERLVPREVLMKTLMKVLKKDDPRLNQALTLLKKGLR